ncbi:MAG TPA: c-type cytochrome [Steroidobacteraceae bacterium]
MIHKKRTLAVALIAVVPVVSAADINAGRAVAQAKCAQCHAPRDWEGESAASLEEIIRDIVAGKVKHRTKIDLTSEEIANIAAYWSAGKS